MGQVIAITSGKGGTGKTTLCAGISACLAAEGKRVLCIDADMGLRNLDISLGMAELAPISFADVLAGRYSLSEATRHPELPRLHLLTAPDGFHHRPQAVNYLLFVHIHLAFIARRRGRRSRPPCRRRWLSSCRPWWPVPRCG